MTGTRAARRRSMLPVGLGLGLVLVGVVILWTPMSWTTEGSGYACDATPIGAVVHPAPTTPGHYFFDEGRACNRDGRGEAAVAAGSVVAGLVTAAWALRRRRTSSPDDARRSGPVVRSAPGDLTSSRD